MTDLLGLAADHAATVEEHPDLLHLAGKGAAPAARLPTKEPDVGSKAKPLDDTEHAAGPLTIARASLPPDEHVQMRRYAEAFKQPVSDFHLIDGHIIRQIPGTEQYARVAPSVRGATGPLDAAERAFDWVAGGAGPAIPAVASGAAAAAAAVLAGPETLGAGALPAAMLASGAGAAGGETMRQKLDAALAKHDGGEVAPMDYGNAGWQGAAGLAGPLAGKGLELLGNRVAPVITNAVADELPEAAKLEKAIIGEGTEVVAGTGGTPAAVDTAKALGLSPAGVAALERQAASHQADIEALQKDIATFREGGAPVDLSLGQKTGSVVLQQKERQMLRDPTTAQDVVDLRKLQNETQIPGAVRSVLDDVTSPSGREDAIGSFRTGADAVIAAAEKKRAELADPLYKEAFGANKSMSSPLLDKLMDTPEGKDAFNFAIKRMQNRMSRVGVPDPELTEQLADLVARGDMKGTKGGVASGLKLETLDLIKQGLWDSEDALRKQVINGTARQGQVDEVSAIRRSFTKELDRLDTTAAAGPNSLKVEGGAYARARQAFGDPSDDIDAMKAGGIGFIQRMKGQDRQGFVTRMFSGGNVLPEEIARTREKFALAGKLDDWNSGLRAHIEEKLADALRPTQKGEVENVGGKLYQGLFAPESADAKVLRAALGGDGAAIMKRWESLGRVMRAAAHQLAEGSPTITDLQAAPVLSRLKFAFDLITKPQNIPGEALDKVTTSQNADAAQKFAKYALTSEGDKILRALYLQTPSSPKALSLLDKMFIQSGVVAGVGAAARDDSK